MKSIYYILLSLALFIGNAFAKDVNYTFNLTEYSYTKDGKRLTDIKINNTTPGPVIKAEMGDTLTVKVVNNTSINTTIHFHGVILPNSQDGVGGVTQEFIKPKTTFTYKFKVSQEGTYWYHAHGFEKAQGLYGGIVFGKQGKEDEELLLYSGKFNKSMNAVFADLKSSGHGSHGGGMKGKGCNMQMESKNSSKDAHSMHHGGEESTKKADGKHMHGDKKHSKHHGKEGKGSSCKKAESGKKAGMHGSSGFHYSDVIAPNHLINSSYKVLELKDKGNGNKLKLRIVNTYVDGFLNFAYSGGKMQVVASDGLPIKPIKVKTLQVAMGETYDIIVDTKKDKSFELVSFILGSNDYSKIIIGNGELVKLKSYNASDYKAENPYSKIKTLTPSYIDLNSNGDVKDFNLMLKGSHASYNWSIKDRKTHDKVEKLNIKVGDKVRVTLKNNTGMPHPMHLHGFFFKVASAKNNLVKHTYNINPKEEVVFEFVADKEGKWLFHCHNLFHMASSMMLTFNIEKVK